MAPPSETDVDRIRALVRLAGVAVRRTALENSAQLLAASAVVVLLMDGARRVDTPHGLDIWLVAALTWAVVLPVALVGDNPLRSTRLALLPVAPHVLGRARVIASAPLRLPLAALLPIVGGLAAHRVASSAAVLALVGWGVIAFFASAVLDAQWHRPRAILPRVLAAAIAAVGGWCLWSLRAAAPLATGGATLTWRPALLPRGDGLAAWSMALAMVAASLTLGVVVLRSRPAPGQPAAGEARRRPASAAVPRRGLQLNVGASCLRVVRPRVAHEMALLTRHIGPRVALAFVAVFACAATYGRVPGLALVAAAPMIILAANALGADVPLAGMVRHRLQPESLAHLRDRRLTVWGVATALAAMLGACVGMALPSPMTAGDPAGGAFGAPAMLLYGATLVPWFGRASWWWARRYPQRFVQGLRDLGTRATTGPTGPAHLALGLLAVWAGVALLAMALFALSQSTVRTLLVGPDALGTAASQVSWLVATLLAAGVAGGTHVALRGASQRVAAPRITVRVEARP
ncbi:MAG: hypothetical protein IPK85_21235 [Gemmatimonadetes bacterium]|nr:hypothetical protein [Gemmatimonadota bacterium]